MQLLPAAFCYAEWAAHTLVTPTGFTVTRENTVVYMPSCFNQRSALPVWSVRHKISSVFLQTRGPPAEAPAPGGSWLGSC